MATQITVPALGESVSEATVAKWMKAVGDAARSRSNGRVQSWAW